MPFSSAYLRPFEGKVCVQAELYLLNVTVLPSIRQVMYTGDTLLRVPEIGYLSTIWVGF